MRIRFTEIFPNLIVFTWIVWVVAILYHGSGGNLFFGQNFDFEKAAQFGDAFGSFSGLMASLAAGGAWYAVHLERQQIKDTDVRRIDEDKDRRTQAFEQNFFQLLKHLSSIVRETDIEIEDWQSGQTKPVTGKDAYREMCSRLRRQINWNLDLCGPRDLKRTYDKFYGRYQDDLGHYFRFLYHITSYVSRTKDIDKAFYMKLIFAQLSNSELILLAYNCAFGRGRDRFKAIVEEYHGLSNIGFNDRLFGEESVLRSSFDVCAFA